MASIVRWIGAVALAAISLLCQTISVIAQEPPAQPWAALSGSAWPAFLPGYFGEVLPSDFPPLRLAKQSGDKNTTSLWFASEDEKTQIRIENVQCERHACDDIYSAAFKLINQQATQAGHFTSITATEFAAEWAGNDRIVDLVFQIPGAVQSWSITGPASRIPSVEIVLDRMLKAVDRFRYERARIADSLTRERWVASSAAHARRLLRDGDKAEAVTVFKDVVSTWATDYDSQLALAENTDDPQVARASAQVVFDNTEDTGALVKAAAILGKSVNVDIPALDAGDGGLRVVLLPLPPCDPLLLRDAMALYRKITDVPIMLRRLPQVWEFAEPERVNNQPVIQAVIRTYKGTATDFTGWTKKDYLAEYDQLAPKIDARGRYYLPLAKKELEEPGQYLVGPYLARLTHFLSPHLAKGGKTLFVGVTGVSIYAKPEDNYVRNQFTETPPVAIYSYHSLLSKTLHNPGQSRRVFSENVAKGLVVTTLSMLGIPRPIDPSDPYSAGNLEQRGLVLSEATRAELDKRR